MIKKWCRKLKSTLRTNLSSCVDYRLATLALLGWSLTITATHFVFWLYLIDKAMTLYIRSVIKNQTIFLAFSYSRASPNTLDVQSTAHGTSTHYDAIDTRIVKPSGQYVHVNQALQLATLEICNRLASNRTAI